MTTDTQNDVLTGWEDLLFGVQRSIRYHARREAFYDGWTTTTEAIGIIFGAGTVIALLGKFSYADILSLVLPAIITVFSTLAMVWGTSRNARVHNDLYRRFVALEKEMITTRENERQALTKAYYAKRLEIEANEPPVKFAVDVLCHNELARARGLNDFYTVSLWQRLWAHLYSFAGTDWNKRLTNV